MKIKAFPSRAWPKVLPRAIVAALVLTVAQGASAQTPDAPPLPSEAGQEPPVAVEAAATGTQAASPWGFWGGFSVGPAWGGIRGPIEPSGSGGLDLAASFHFVYVGTGFLLTWFKGVNSFSQDTTGGVRSSGAPISGAGYLEAGLTHGLFIPYSPTEAIELRPGFGYGYELMSSATQTISKCVDCSSHSYDYAGGQYLRFQLGVYYSVHPQGSTRYRVFMARNGFFMGGTVSVQHFIFRSDPQLQDALMFGCTVGFGP